jgi:hypothetical protein
VISFLRALLMIIHYSPIPDVLRHLPYLKSLPPPDALLIPLQFTPSELEAFQGTNIYGATRDRQEYWSTEWNTCQTFILAVNPNWAERFTWYALPCLLSLRTFLKLDQGQIPKSIDVSFNPHISIHTSISISYAADHFLELSIHASRHDIPSRGQPSDSLSGLV